MILPGNEIEKLRLIFPFHKRTREYGVTFGMSPAGYDVRIAQDVHFDISSFRLCSTIEQFDVPLDILGIVHDKSTWARRGLAVQNTVIEPGWKGYLTLEITNHGTEKILIKKGTGICQIIFHKLLYPTFEYEGKYQNQKEGPQEAIMEKV